MQQLLDGLDEVDAELTPATEAGQPLVQRVLVPLAVRDLSDIVRPSQPESAD